MRTMKPSTPTTEVLLARAEAGEADARKKRDEAAAQAAYAKREFFEEQTPTRRATKRQSEEDLEAAEHALGLAVELLAQARSAHAAHVRGEKMKQYEAHKAHVVALKDAIGEKAQAVIALDKQLDEVVLEIVRVVAHAGDAYVEAERLAADLGLQGDLDRTTVRPDVPEARLQIQRTLTADRVESKREDLSLWLQGVADDWRTKDRTAKIQREIAVYEKTKAERERQAELALARAIGQSQAPPQKPMRRPLTEPLPGEPPEVA
jgi:hypothetical protein